MFAIGLICFLAGGVCAALYANHHVERREIAAFGRGNSEGFGDGYRIACEEQKARGRIRAQKAAKTRKERKS